MKAWGPKAGSAALASQSGPSSNDLGTQVFLFELGFIRGYLGIINLEDRDYVGILIKGLLFTKNYLGMCRYILSGGREAYCIDFSPARF